MRVNQDLGKKKYFSLIFFGGARNFLLCSFVHSSSEDDENILCHFSMQSKREDLNSILGEVAMGYITDYALQF